MYKDFTKFINKGKERLFNDSLINVIVTEIKLKSRELNEYMILPRNCNQGILYNGEFYEKSNMIINMLSAKSLIQAKKLVKEGSEVDFKNTFEIKE